MTNNYRTEKFKRWMIETTHPLEILDIFQNEFPEKYGYDTKLEDLDWDEMRELHDSLYPGWEKDAEEELSRTN